MKSWRISLYSEAITEIRGAHVLLTGPPATCKTMFLLEMAKRLDKTYFMDATSASGPGMIDYLFETNLKYLLVDEIDKLQRKDQCVLLNLMENSVLVETKVRKTRKKEMMVSVFATCNDIAKISKALNSRTFEFGWNDA